MMTKKAIVAALAIGIVLSGCGGPKAKSIDEQKQVIQMWLDAAKQAGAQCTIQASFDGNPEFYLSSGAGMKSGLTAQASFSANAK